MRSWRCSHEKCKGRGRTAILRKASLGWQLFGPSSQMYPSPDMLVMLPPTRSLASVTRTLPALSAWVAVRACAVHSPEIPAPT